MDAYNSPTTKPIYRGTQVVWYITDVIEMLLLFRFFLKFLGANPGAGFTHFIYSVTHPLVAPFLNVFRVSAVSGSVFEWTTLLAMAVYWIIAVGIVKMFFMGKTVSTPEAAGKLEEQERDI